MWYMSPEAEMHLLVHRWDTTATRYRDALSYWKAVIWDRCTDLQLQRSETCKPVLYARQITEWKKHPSTNPGNAPLFLSGTMIFNEISSLLDGLGLCEWLTWCKRDCSSSIILSGVCCQFTVDVLFLGCFLRVVSVSFIIHSSLA
jgi:hypothetical protein